MSSLVLKRVYEPVSLDDGMRVLVDRLWPRGVRKEDAAIDVWLKAIAPSPELRSWFGHDPAKFPEFRDAYERQLWEDAEHLDAVAKVLDWMKAGQVTLIYAAKDANHNHAVVLRDVLLQRWSENAT